MNVTTGTQAVDIAKQWLGTPYQWGGGHGGQVPVGTPVDCSGLVNQVFGISGNTYSQESMGSAITGISQAAPGDLVFFGPLAPNEAFHVGIYTGMGMMIDAPHTGSTVRYDTVAQFGQIAAIRRLVPTGDATGTSGNTGPALYNYAQLEGVWIQAGGPAQWAPMAAAIAMAESGGNPNVSNTNSNNSTDRGLWQINTVNGSASSYDVMTNARAAVAISNKGTNWRSWCTAYSDSACGSKGGAYLGPGSPYQKYYNPSVQPDMSVPINATNAAAVLTSSSGNASEAATTNQLGTIGCIFNIEGCTEDVISKTIKAIMITVLTPLIQFVAGVLGVAAGVVIMIWGIYVVIGSTQGGQRAEQGAKKGLRLGAQVVAPESYLAGAVRQTYEKTLPSGQTQITTVVGQRRPFGRYRQRTQRDTYGVPTSQRGQGRPTNVGQATYSGPGASARPQGAAPDTKNLLRGEASSYPATQARHTRRGPGGRFYPRGS